MKPENYTMLIDESIEYFNVKNFYINNTNGLSKQYKTNSGTIIEEGVGEQGSWFVSYATRPYSLFSIYKEYNSRGIIKCKRVIFRNGGAVVGMKYEFDNHGKLQRKEDTEAYFQFTPNQVIQYCLNNDIDLLAHDRNYVDRYIDMKNKESSYIINYMGKYDENSSRISIILSGRNGDKERVLIQRPGHGPKVVFDKNLR